MRTTLDLPQDLIDEVRKACGFKSKTDTVTYALQELLRKKQREMLKNLSGKVEFIPDMDAYIAKSRGRPAPPARKRKRA